MATIICSWFQPSDDVPEFSKCFDGSWVDKLYRGVSRHLSDFRFICLTDIPSPPLAEPVEVVRLTGSFRGCHNLMEAYRDDLDIHDVRIIVGLDTIIVGSLRDLASYDGHFAAPLDPYAKPKICAGCLLVSPTGAEVIWEQWKHTGVAGFYGNYPSEMMWMREHVPCRPDLLDTLYPGQVLSYKCHIKNPKDDQPVHDPKVIYFHGRPKPHELPQDPWVREHWL